MNKLIAIRHRKPSEEGYMLVVVIFMLAILMLALTVAAPVIKQDIQRDRELETMHRGKQYARAVKLYYKRFGAYPPSVDALVNTNEIRFLRKKYIDPTTGKDDWKVIHFGEQKTVTMGFFGQPLGISSAPVAGGGPVGGIGGLGGQTGIGTAVGGLNPAAGSDGTTDSTDSSSGPMGSSSTTGAIGGSASSPAGTTDPNAPGGSSGTGSATGLSGQTFGGPIIGFSPNSPKQSLLVYKKKNHYNEWEFIYDPIADQMMMQGGNIGAIGQPAGGASNGSSIGSGSSGFGSQTGGSNPVGAAPMPPSTTPQQ